MRQVSVLVLRAALLAAAMVAAGCAGGVDAARDLVGSQEAYTLVDLHPDERRSVLYAANFLQDGLIPVCSRVTLTSLDRKELEFRVEATGKTYRYINHKASAESFTMHLRRYFGRECDAGELKRLSAVDQRGVQEGKAAVGMTRRGVTLALGYPPSRETPDLNGSKWKYWRSRFDTLVIEFDDTGKVSKIVN